MYRDPCGGIKDRVRFGNTWEAPIRIGFDIAALTSNRTGVGNYCYYLLEHLLREENREHQFLGFVANRPGVELGQLQGRFPIRHVPVPTRAMYAIWNRLRFPKVDRLLGGLDLYHSTNFYLPPVGTAKTVMTIHDLAFLIEPKWTSPALVAPFRERILDFAQRTDAILTYSNSTANDIVRLLGVSREKIAIAPMGVDEGFQPMPRETASRMVREGWGISDPFVLFVSTLEPRKNVTGLIQAFERIARSHPHHLVLIGSTGWNADPILRAIETSPVRDRIVRPGFVPHGDLPAFYCAADAFLFPTHYEGFGLPVLEALTCGCPVVSTKTSSVPEISDEAAMLAQPGDLDEFAAMADTLLDDESMRLAMIESGKVQASRFSWQACAETTMGVYHQLVSE